MKRKTATTNPKSNIGWVASVIALAIWSLTLFRDVEASHKPDALVQAVIDCRNHAASVGLGWRYDSDTGCELKF